MVGVVIIVGTTVGVMALGFSERATDSAPAASFDYTTGLCGDIEITHTGGPAIDGDRLYLGGAAEEYTTPSSIPGWNTTSVGGGDSVSVSATPGEELTLQWQADGGDSTTVISRYDVPSHVAVPRATVEITTINIPYQQVKFSVSSLRNVDGPVRVTVFDDGVADTTVTIPDSPGEFAVKNRDLSFSGDSIIRVRLESAGQGCVLGADTKSPPLHR
jgi:hypothetical protein